MYLNDNEIIRFLGTGEVNADGDTLSAFLEKYDPKKYLSPCNTVDTVVFTYIQENGIKEIKRVLLIKRGNHPSIGWWALPGGFVDYRENIDDAALRELQEETGVENIDVCQLKCYGDYDRDPRTRVITTAYVAIIPDECAKARAGDDASDSGWFDISSVITHEKTEEDYNYSYYRLNLNEKKKGVEASAEIEVQNKVNSILPQVSYHVMDADLIASDHGAIILEAYHFVKKCLNSKKSE